MAPPERGSKERGPRGAAPQADNYAPAREAGGADLRRRTPAEIPAPPRRNFRLALAIALIVFGLLIVVRVLWGGLGNPHGAPTLPPAQPPAQTSGSQDPPAPSN